ncbi:hypothetical protein [Mycolicibacterium litorale]|nr:hypothetical protein [Mycolicibacterium litorale]
MPATGNATVSDLLVFGHVLEGRILFEREGAPRRGITAGESFREPHHLCHRDAQRRED